jgi:hypothetical protein
MDDGWGTMSRVLGDYHPWIEVAVAAYGNRGQGNVLDLATAHVATHWSPMPPSGPNLMAGFAESKGKPFGNGAARLLAG